MHAPVVLVWPKSCCWKARHSSSWRLTLNIWLNCGSRPTCFPSSTYSKQGCRMLVNFCFRCLLSEIYEALTSAIQHPYYAIFKGRISLSKAQRVPRRKQYSHHARILCPESHNLQLIWKICHLMRLINDRAGKALGSWWCRNELTTIFLRITNIVR